MMRSNKQASFTLNCRQCGGTFSAQRKSRGRHPGFCSMACRDLAAKAQADRYRADRRYEHHQKCCACEAPFSTLQRKVQETCSVACSTQLRSRRAAARRREFTNSLAVGDLFAGCDAPPPAIVDRKG